MSLHNLDASKEESLNELRGIIQRIEQLDGGLAVDIDRVVHNLEMIALEEGRIEGEKAVGVAWKEVCNALMEERNAARADLMRIRTIVNNPLIIVDNNSVTDGQTEQPSGSPTVT